MSTTRVGILDENKEYFWKTVNGVRTKVGPGWRNVSVGYVKVDGEWKEVFVRPGPTVRNFRLDPITNDSVTFQWYAGPNVIRSELWIGSRTSGTSTPVTFARALDINSTYVTPSGQKIVLQQGSAIVTGIGTNFTSLVPENIIYTQIDGARTLVGTVKSVQSNTSLTLKSEWTGLSSADPLVGDTYIYQTNNSYLYNTNRETEYFFYLIPIEQVGAEEVPGDKSNTIQRITPVGAPPPITDLSIIFEDGKLGTFTLGWTPSPRYRTDSYIYYDNGGDGTNQTTAKAPSPFESLDGKEDRSVSGSTNATYQIQIQAFNDIGEGSGKSNLVTFQYKPIVAKTLKSPTISGSFLPATNNTSNWNTITISWFTNPTDHDYYEIWAKPATSSTYARVSSLNINPTDAATTRTLTYTGPSQNTQYDVQLRTYANAPGDGYSWSGTPPVTQVTSNVIRFKTGQPRLTDTREGNDSKTITGTRTTTAVSTAERSINGGAWQTTGVSTSYPSIGYVGTSGGSIVTTYTVRTRSWNEARTRRNIFSGWSGWSRITSFDDSFSNQTSFFGGTQRTETIISTTATRQVRRVTERTITSSTRTRNTTTYTTEYDFSASAIKLGGGQTLSTSTLSIVSSGGAYSINVNVGGTNYSEVGSVSLTNSNIYNKLIIASNRVRLTRNTSPLATYSTGTVRVTYTYSYTVVTQNFGAPALV
jgi:hypothetical protein